MKKNTNPLYPGSTHKFITGGQSSSCSPRSAELVLHPIFHLESRIFPTPQVDSVHTGASAWGIMGCVVENLLLFFFKLRLKIALSITAGDRI